MFGSGLFGYDIKETIGRGTFSQVKLGKDKATSEKVAIKIIDKSKIKDSKDIKRIEREIKIIKQISHLNVIKTIKVKEDTKNVYIIMEYCNYDLFLHITNKRKLQEKEAAMFYYQLINGLDYLHSKNISHRDLKPENLLITKGNILKIIDFGLSNFYYNNCDLLETPCGSPSYAAPEMVAGKKYDGFSIDIWSTGIILYAMLCGYLPFEAKDNKDLFYLIMKCKVVYPKSVSIDGINLLKKILVKDPEKRIKMDQIKKHRFYLLGENVFDKLHKTSDIIESNRTLSNFNIKIKDSNIIKNNCLNEKSENDINDIQKSNSTNGYIRFKSFGGKTEYKNKLEKNKNDFIDKDNNIKHPKRGITPFLSSFNSSQKNHPNFVLLKKILRGSRFDSYVSNNDCVSSENGQSLSQRVSEDSNMITPTSFIHKKYLSNKLENNVIKSNNQNTFINLCNKKRIREITPINKNFAKNDYINNNINNKTNTQKNLFPNTTTHDDIIKNFLFNSYIKNKKEKKVNSIYDIKLNNESNKYFSKYNSNGKFQNDTSKYIKKTSPSSINNHYSYHKIAQKNPNNCFKTSNKKIVNNINNNNSSSKKVNNRHKKDYSQYQFNNKSTENRKIRQKNSDKYGFKKIEATHPCDFKSRENKNRNKKINMNSTSLKKRNNRNSKAEQKQQKNHYIESMLSRKILGIKKYYELYSNDKIKPLKLEDLILFKHTNVNSNQDNFDNHLKDLANSKSRNDSSNDEDKQKYLTVENTYRKNNTNIKIIIKKRKVNNNTNNNINNKNNIISTPSNKNSKNIKQMRKNRENTKSLTIELTNNLIKENRLVESNKKHKKKKSNGKKNILDKEEKFIKRDIQEIIKKRCLGKRGKEGLNN